MRKVLNGRQFFSFVPKFMMTVVNTHITMITCAVNAYVLYLCASKRSILLFVVDSPILLRLTQYSYFIHQRQGGKFPMKYYEL